MDIKPTPARLPVLHPIQPVNEFDAWARDLNMLNVEIAAYLGVGSDSVGQWRKGRHPSWENKIRIRDASGGRVSLDSWAQVSAVA